MVIDGQAIPLGLPGLFHAVIFTEKKLLCYDHSLAAVQKHWAKSVRKLLLHLFSQYKYN